MRYVVIWDGVVMHESRTTMARYAHQRGVLFNPGCSSGTLFRTRAAARRAVRRSIAYWADGRGEKAYWICGVRP